MKKSLLFLMAMLSAWYISAAPVPEGDENSGQTPGGETENPDINASDGVDVVQGMSLKEIVNQLKEVQAYVFLGEGEERDIKNTIVRAREKKHDVLGKYNDLKDFAGAKWSITNPGIASLSNNGIMKGERFGETIFTIQMPKKDGESGYDIIRLAVFVAPTITVLSPEGVIYQYPKTLNQRARVQLTEGNNYFINCVMVKGLYPDDYDPNNLEKELSENPTYTKWFDITSQVSIDKGDNKGVTDGFFETPKGLVVNRNLVFVISEEETVDENADRENGVVVGSSGINARVYDGKYVAFVPDDDITYGPTDLSNYDVTVYDLMDRRFKYTPVEDFNQPGIDNLGDMLDAKKDKSKVIKIEDDGVYKIELTDESGKKIPGHFKVIIHNFENISAVE